ncbi:MAG: histidine ammonia-lyase [Candidatus Yanofskybacteria bacterium CG10_big_fil_rev_8_21_14_0_10_36_16]|uniref:Histidine ammonia-lyase n=1 Tax=Candidatus Yanofskybacteria bacterium CG10_big_fil_rev_8_21_14_0_10_36_16 TaxID=1975096 RepID=A0A2J0Q6L3_9BACT|nr:MAG: histidine ammonia-lyase [Candidatus Yanofskybacteria bacterium CG10_big_fil_rev_8_21_14_0_10_36_16]
MKTQKTIQLGNEWLTINDCHEVARQFKIVQLLPKVKINLEKSRAILSNYIDKHVPVYGISTQFGGQVNLTDEKYNISDHPLYLKALEERQGDLIRSHTAGLGDESPEDSVRAAMLVRARCLSLGYSGVSAEPIKQLVNFLNYRIHPIVPKYGSIGASGDLIPLSHIASALCGHDIEVKFKNKKIKVQEAMQQTGISPLKLKGREGLALINGTSFMTGISSLAIYDLNRLFNQILSAIAMSLEALGVMDSAYEPLVHELKNHPGATKVNNYLLCAWHGSKLIRKLDSERKEFLSSYGASANNHHQNTRPLQDYYSLRSIPQGFGPFWENLNRSVKWVEREINSVNDNPVIDPESGKIHHAANFMGYYITDTCDILKIDISQASTWMHAILANLVHPRKNFGLPANLVERPAVYSGFRPYQILSASIAVQNRKLAQSQQSFTIPTEGDNQDVNSLGTHAAFDLKEAVSNLELITAIIFLAASQALDLRGIENASNHSRKIRNIIRRECPKLTSDRSPSEEIKKMINIMRRQ